MVRHTSARRQDLPEFLGRRPGCGKPVGLYGASCRKKFKNRGIHVVFRANLIAASLSQATA